jgi:hypothetical protein
VLPLNEVPTVTPGTCVRVRVITVGAEADPVFPHWTRRDLLRNTTRKALPPRTQHSQPREAKTQIFRE